MAVNVNENDQDTNANFDRKATQRRDSDRNGESSSRVHNINMSSVKRERRKPEVQIYRPGQGLQNKNPRTDDLCPKEEKKTPGYEQEKQKAQPSNLDNDKTKPKGRNRRPDIQVYMPKGKLIAQQNEKLQENLKNLSLSSGKEERDNNVLKKSVDQLLTNKSENGRRNRNSDRDVPIKHIAFNKDSTSSSPLPSLSWADQMEESDLSNSRKSTPDNKQCNGLAEDSSNSQVPKTEKVKSSKRKSRKARGRRKESSLKKESSEVQQRNEESKSKNDSSRRRRNSNNSDLRAQVTSEERPLHSPRNREFTEDNLRITSICNSRGKDVSDSSSRYELSSEDIKERKKTERKKRDKIEAIIPPRFQRQKTNSESSQGSSHGPSAGGGILKLPQDYDIPNHHLDLMDNSMYIPKPFPEPQPTYIHKQLFDPNNPGKPEIINIPAPSPAFPKPYFSDPLISNPSYIPPPFAQNMGYIPPPQPPPRYQYESPDVPVNSAYHGIREAPVQDLCPAQAARLKATFPFIPASCFSESYSVAESTTGKKRLKPIVEKNLYEIVLLEKELTTLISRGLLDTNLNALKQCRWKLQLRYENIILADPKYCAEKNPEQNLWKIVFHQVIEFLRKKLEEGKCDKETTTENLLNVILEGSMFYENLLEKQQETYGFKLAKLFELEFLNSSCLPEQLRCVLISVQKSLIYLGDLARYKEHSNETSNFGKARSWYLKAQQIAPKNGRPYHQLALLAFSTRRKLDAVYYYMRSLAASNPFLSAKESLLSLFDEAKKKYEQYDNKKLKDCPADIDLFENDSTKRCEVWIKPDGSSSQRNAELDRKETLEELKKLSDVELNKRFLTSFLHAHGKLFTKVGMDSFLDALSNTLKEFYVLLQRTPIPMTSTRLLQLLAINIFSVTNSSLKEKGRDRGCSSPLQEQALYTSMAMMSLLIQRCNTLHRAATHSNHPINDDLAQLLPSVSIWTDWMSCQAYFWPPPPPHVLERLNVGFHIKSVWESFADFLTSLSQIDTSCPLIMNQRPNSDCEPIILEEDGFFAGFVPLLEALHESAYCLKPVDKDRAKHCLRISRIQFFGDYLCGTNPPFMKFDIGDRKYVSLANFETANEDLRGFMTFADGLSSDEDSIIDDLCQESMNQGSENVEMQQLWSRKEALSKAKEQQEKHKAEVQAILQLHQSQRRIVIKIRPRYLIPDTNCFVDHLQEFKNILSSTDFNVMIPLVVMNELDGLSKGSKAGEHTSQDHINRVTILSQEAICFLEQQFASRHPHLRAITSKGSTLDTLSFRSEETGANKGTNDDLILTCCLNYRKDWAESYQKLPKNAEDPITLFREVVLLTDDRNLRVKALAHHVPVQDVPSFLRWLKS